MRARTIVTLLLSAILLLAACGEEEAVEETGISFPHTVTLAVEQALVAPTGEIIAKADFLTGDLVAFTNQSIKFNTGCETSLAHCRPLHICRPSVQSKYDTFASLADVCLDIPAVDEGSVILNAEEKMGFTIRLNSDTGCARFWVKELNGLGGSASAVLVYDLFDCGS
jgi:hypothetical protein